MLFVCRLIMIPKIFLNADKCIGAAAAYANKTGEKCICQNGENINNLGFYIEFPNKHFKYTSSWVRAFFGKEESKPLFDLIIDNYCSVEHFINNHSALINFI